MKLRHCCKTLQDFPNIALNKVLDALALMQNIQHAIDLVKGISEKAFFFLLSQRKLLTAKKDGS